jgi:MoaA/NifB/PqqE/SkfB family radical SAM enzyme
MTPAQLGIELEKRYKVLGFVDLADLSESPTSAFNFFKSLYQESYNDNDCIVVYSSEHSIPDELIEYLYQTANFIDISNWFILFCTPVDISDQLKKTCKDSSTDSVPFRHATFDVKKTKPLLNNYLLSDIMCAIPWTNLEIKSTGEISPCCVFNGNIGHIKHNSLKEVFHGSQILELRNDLINGRKHPGCKVCWDKESKGLTSNRQHNAKRLKQSFLEKHFEQPTITSLDIKFQNTCNFKCRICSPISSSLYADETRKFKNIQPVPQLQWSESDQFITQINELLPTLTNIDMYGGEPFLIKKFSSVLKTAIDQGHAKNIRLHYNTNGSVWPSEFIEYWKKFQQVDIHFSIDSVGKQFELQRGGCWEKVESNILRIKNLNYPNMSLSVMPTISIMNVYYIDQVIDWANKHKFQIFVGYVTDPKEYALSNLTQQAKDIILEKHRNNNWPEMKKILNSIKTSPAADGSLFCQKTQWFDSIRNENFAETHPEIAKAMGYVYNKDL